MNELTKEVIKRILNLGVQGMYTRNGGYSLWYKDNRIVSSMGDVNYGNWNDNTLKHDYFKFDDRTGVYIETSQQADEFVNIVANYFGSEAEENNQVCELGKVTIDEYILEPIIYYNENGEMKQKLEYDKNTKLYKQTYPKLTRSERLQQVYNDVLGEIVEELEKEFGKGFEIREREITKDDAIIAFLVGEFLEVFDSEFIEINGCVQVPIDEVKVCKPLNVDEELCKIEMPGNLRLAKNVYGRVVLKCGTISIDTIYYEPTRKIYSSKLFVKKQQEELYKKFGSVLKPEQGKEFVEWVAEALGGDL